MLKGINNQDLVEAGLKREHVLFYQTWKELTEGKTFDSYQYKSINSLTGICELIHNITSYLEGVAYTTHSLDAVREELLSILKRDIIIANTFPSIRNQLLQNLGKKYDLNSQLKGLRYQLEYCYTKLKKDYDVALMRRLALSVDGQAKAEEQYILTSQFISRCVDLGWSVRALFGKIDALKNEPSKNESIEDFLSKIVIAKKQQYAIFLPFRFKVTPKTGSTKEEARNAVIRQLESFEIEVKNGEQITHIFPAIDSSQLKNTQDYIIVKAEACDVFSAAHFAIVTLSRVLNIFSFFTTIESWSVNDLALIAYNIL